MLKSFLYSENSELYSQATTVCDFPRCWAQNLAQPPNPDPASKIRAPSGAPIILNASRTVS